MRPLSEERRMKSMNFCLSSVKPAVFFPKVIHCNEWLRRLQTTPQKVTVNLSESLARGYDTPWMTWRCLNDYVQHSHAARNRDRNRGTSKETPSVSTVWQQKIAHT